MTQVPVEARGQGSRWVSLPHPSPGVQEARDAESLILQTPRKKDPASWGKVSKMEGPQKSGHTLEVPPQPRCPEATKLLFTGPCAPPFLLQDGPASGSGQVSRLIPASCVCTFEGSVPAVVQRWGASGDLGELGSDLNDTYMYVLFFLPNPQLGVLRIFWHKVWLE